MQKIIVFILIFYVHTSYGRSNVQLELNIGNTFQSELLFNNQIIDHPSALAIRFGGNIQIPLTPNIYFETGATTKFIRGKYESETVYFKSKSLKLQLPLLLGFHLSPKWSINIGSSIENNLDFNKIDFVAANNFRCDFLTKVIYHFSDAIHLSFLTNVMMSNLPDLYTISNPRTGMYIGLIYQFRGKKNSTEF